MLVKNQIALRTIFALKGNFARGLEPRPVVHSGIEIAPFKNGALAAACISADFEMGWGWRSRGREGAAAMGLAERRQVPLIVALLAEYDVPITWATIGHLFLESCSRSPSGLAHPDMPRPKSDGTWSGDWYWPDPCSNVRDAPAWYGPDLIQHILDAKAGHEIGSHSFSHINFEASYSNPEVVSAELSRCSEVMRPFGVKPSTLIFPRHQAEYAYLPLLGKAGVIAVRHRDQKVRLSYPERTAEGVYRIYESMNLRIARHYDYSQKVQIFVADAIRRRAAYALWFHPSDPAEWFEPQLRQILDYLVQERRLGRIWITTMRDLAAYCEARERITIQVERVRQSVTLTLASTLDSDRYGQPEVSLLLPSTAKPLSVWIGHDNGDRVPVSPQVASDGTGRLMLNMPPSARIAHLDFDPSAVWAPERSYVPC